MIDEEGNSMMGITQDQLDKALDQASEVIPDCLAPFLSTTNFCFL